MSLSQAGWQRRGEHVGHAVQPPLHRHCTHGSFIPNKQQASPLPSDVKSRMPRNQLAQLCCWGTARRRCCCGGWRRRLARRAAAPLAPRPTLEPNARRDSEDLSCNLRVWGVGSQAECLLKSPGHRHLSTSVGHAAAHVPPCAPWCVRFEKARRRYLHMSASQVHSLSSFRRAPSRSQPRLFAQLSAAIAVPSHGTATVYHRRAAPRRLPNHNAGRHRHRLQAHCCCSCSRPAGSSAPGVRDCPVSATHAGPSAAAGGFNTTPGVFCGGSAGLQPAVAATPGVTPPPPPLATLSPALKPGVRGASHAARAVWSARVMLPPTLTPCLGGPSARHAVPP